MNAIVAFVRRRWRMVAILGGVVALYAAVGFLWLPAYARGKIENYVHSELHRKVAIGELTFNPFTLTAEVNHFTLTEADDTAIAAFDRLVLNAQLSSLIYRGAVFKEISLDNPRALVRVNADGTLNLANLAPAGDANAESSSELPILRIQRFSLRSGRIEIEDRSRPRPFKALLAPIEFSLDNFRTEPKFGNAYRFVASTADGEKLEWSGEFSVQPLGSKGQFSLSNIRAATIAAYLQDTLPFRLPSGILDLSGDYNLSFTDRTDFRLQLPSVKVRELGIAPLETESPPWISVPELTVAGVNLSLAGRSISVGSVQASDAVIDAWRESDGKLNLASLLDAKSGAEEAASVNQQVPAAAPWTIDVKSIQLQRARVTAEDRSNAPIAKVVVSPIDINLSNYSSKAGASMAIDAAVGFDGRGSLTTSGPISLTPLAVDLKVAVADFDLSLLQPYARQSTDLTIHRGRLNAQTQIRYTAEPSRSQPGLKFTGNVGVVDLLTKDNALEEDFIKWKSLQIAGLDYQQNPDRLTIARIVAIKPYGRIIIASNGSLNITQILNPSSAAAVTEDSQSGVQPVVKAEPTPMPARIRTIVVEDGAASFADYSVSPSFAAEIGELKGSVEGLTSERDSRAKLALAGSVDRYAPVSITGEINLLSANAYSDIALTFRNMELTTFNPYSGKFAGYNITKGKLTTEMQYKVDNRLLDARHHIVIDQLEFGDATNSKDAVSLPIKLAVALLKDRHGVIDLDLPISGNIDDPSFRVGPIIWQVLKNTLEKIVTAPFALLGRLFGGGEELAFIDFAHGSAALTPDVSAKLQSLKQAMIERPQLKLDVPMQTIDDDDRAVLAREAMEYALISTQKAEADRIASLTAIYTKEFGKAPAFPEIIDKSVDVGSVRTRFLEDALLTRYAATPAQLEDLGRSRGNAVRDALLEGGEIPPERVFLSNRAPDGKALEDSVRMELKLE